jgi:predicted NACHT family NTPase
MGFFESLLSAAAPDAAKALADFILDIPKAGISKGWTLEKAQRAASQYQERFAKIHGQIKPLGMSEPVPVKDIYTAVQVTENIASFASREELEKAMRLQGLRNLPVGHIKTRAGIDVANDEQFLNVLGGPGAGKTTFLQRLGLEALLHTPTGVLSLFSNRDRLYKHRCLPVFLEPV